MGYYGYLFGHAFCPVNPANSVICLPSTTFHLSTSLNICTSLSTILISFTTPPPKAPWLCYSSFHTLNPQSLSNLLTPCPNAPCFFCPLLFLLLIILTLFYLSIYYLYLTIILFSCLLYLHYLYYFYFFLLSTCPACSSTFWYSIYVLLIILFTICITKKCVCGLGLIFAKIQPRPHTHFLVISIKHRRIKGFDERAGQAIFFVFFLRCRY